MLELGKTQKLKVVKKVEFGVYLAEADNQDERVLLPAKQVPQETEIGDELEVFLYKDSSDRLIATTKKPLLEIGTPAVLTVAQTGNIGAFLDWGLEKDLLLPFKEQTKKVAEGERCLVALYVDKSIRLCATMNVYEQLRTDSPYQEGDEVTGVIYEGSKQFGAFVAVDYQYSALISKQEYHGEYVIGDVITARVTGIREDGKLNLSIRKKGYLQIEEDAKKIMLAMERYEGELPFHDKLTPPEEIEAEFHMSKAAFKRAIGYLLKNGSIEITDTTIKRK